MEIVTWTNGSQGIKLWHCLQFPADTIPLPHPVLDALYFCSMLQSGLDQEYKADVAILIPLLSKTLNVITFFPTLHIIDPKRQYYAGTNTFFSSENC